MTALLNFPRHRAAASPCEALEDAPMHTAATWLELAANTRTIADSILDRAERCVMLDIAADYERQAQESSFAWNRRYCSVHIRHRYGRKSRAAALAPCGGRCCIIPDISVPTWRRRVGLSSRTCADADDGGAGGGVTTDVDENRPGRSPDCRTARRGSSGTVWRSVNRR